jgi:hypothetical protein
MKTENRIITIIGPHAGETEDKILSRKVSDIEKADKTFWLIKEISDKTLKEVQEFCENSESEVKIYFISPATPKGARDTKDKTVNKEYFDGDNWKKIPEGISPVTGKGYAFILKKLEMQDNSPKENFELFTQTKIDINEYAKESALEPIKFSQKTSTILAIKEDMTSHPNKNISNIRTVWAVGTLEKPYYVKVRK